MEPILQQIAQFLYGQPRDGLQVPVAAIRAELPAIQPGDLDHGIHLMRDGSLLRIGLAGDSVELTHGGKLLFEKACVAEVCLGAQFIIGKYRDAVKHIVLQDSDGDEAGGTGFFCADFPGSIATARHLVSGGATLLRVENEDGTVLSGGPFEVRVAGADLDLALVTCNMPGGVTPLRIEWEQRAVSELDRVLVVGYPPIAHHAPAVVFSEGQIASFAKKQNSDRYSTIISKMTEPGYSGGPVLNSTGLVVGVIEQENVFQRKDGGQSIFVGATPAHYFLAFQ